MKAYTHLLIVVGSLFLIIACSERFVDAEPRSDGVVTEITAYINDSTKTKTGILDNDSGGKTVVWKSGNAISLFFNNGDSGGSKFTTENNGTIATFTGTISVVSGDLSGSGGSASFWALYPYYSASSCDGSSITTILPYAQAAYAGDLSDDLLVTIGRSPNPAIYFRNVCSVIEFTLSQENITQICFTGRYGEKIAGEFQASFDNNNKVVSTPTVNGVETIIISPAESLTFSTGVKYYFVLLPGTFSHGYKLTFTRADGYEASYTSSAAITLNPGLFYTMNNKDNGLSFYAPSFATPSPVDLGLSVKWASFNLGASSPVETGYYYAWGELSPKAIYRVENYRWCNGSTTSLTKYNNNSSIGLVDNLNTLEPVDDVAHKMLGGRWRFPTYNEFLELVRNCTWEWVLLNGAEGYQITSPTTGNSIFLPTTGWKNGLVSEWSESYCIHWTSKVENQTAWANGCTNDQYYGNAWMPIVRYYGVPVRPVYE